MEKKKLISLRLNPDTLSMIEKISGQENLFTRSSVIEAVLNSVLTCASYAVIWRMLTTKFAYEKGYTIDFKIDADALKKRQGVTNYD